MVTQKVYLKQITIVGDQCRYKVTKCINSIAYRVGEYLNDGVVASLCNDAKWTVTIT